MSLETVGLLFAITGVVVNGYLLWINERERRARRRQQEIP